MSYIANTPKERDEMLRAIGLERIEELFTEIPEDQRFPGLDIPPPLTEMEVARCLGELASRNQDVSRHPSFLGAGAYRHFVPAAVRHILGRSEFYTSYTPYQAEASQGTLTTIFEYQTMICALTGMEAANASMYDGATALAEAALMAARVTRRDRIMVSEAVHPQYRQVLDTYVQGLGLSVGLVPQEGGLTLSTSELPGDVACLLIQHPNFFGCLEDLEALAARVHDVGGLLAVAADPIALGLFKPPGEWGADIVVGEGQPLGSPMAFGGPYLGFFATRGEFLRQMPGRLVGMTEDDRGRRGFVLTLQAREQHIRREKATCNICSNEALVALAATVYLAMMGSEGLREVAEACYHKAHHLADRLTSLSGYELVFSKPFFKEFALRCPVPPSEINAALWERGIVGGYDLGRDYPALGDCLLLCATEMNTREEMDRLVSVAEEVA
jgi:glycine dehydrogenase subunit 1